MHSGRYVPLAHEGWAECTNLDQYVFHPMDGDPVLSDYPGFGYPGSATMKFALEAFAADIGGEAAFPISPEEIHHATAVLEAITISANTGKTIEIAKI